MNIQLNKKTVDIALLCMCAILVFGFKYSTLGLGLAFACLCGIIATESWYKKITDKIDNWCGRHKWFRRIYSGVLSLPIILLCGMYVFNVVMYGGLYRLDGIMWLMASLISIIVTVGMHFISEKKNQNSLPRLITYVVAVFLFCMSMFKESTSLYLLCLILLIAGGTMLYKIKTDKK